MDCKIIPVILNGGSGKRLWPMSRQDNPKQFLSLLGERTLFQETVERVMRVADVRPEQIVTVTLEDFAEGVRQQADLIHPDIKRHVLVEPQARNTAAAFVYAAYYVREKFGKDALMWVLPSDHHVADEDSLRAALEKAVAAANDDMLVTFGIEPTHPETGYGYIAMGEMCAHNGVHAVRQFVEKPVYEVAKHYVDSGEFLWSSGMHLFKACNAIDAFIFHAREIAEGVKTFIAQRHEDEKLSASTYAAIQKLPYEQAVLEKADGVAVVPCSIGWSDIGSWRSLWDISEKDEGGNVTDGRVVCKDTNNTYVKSYGDRLITCIGVDDLIIADSGDAIMIAGKDCSDGIKAVVESLSKMDSKEVFKTPRKQYNWGTSELMSDEDNAEVYEVSVRPGQERSGVIAERGNELWVVNAGQARFMINGQEQILKAPHSVFIPAGAEYSVQNIGQTALRLFEFKHEEAIQEDSLYIGGSVNVRAA